MTETLTESPTVKVGDFFVCSWGYDQTNVDFYKVVGLTPSGKSVKVQQWSSSASPDSGSVHDSVVPGDKPRTYVDWSGVDQDADFWTQKEQKVTKDVPVETRRLNSYGEGESKRFYFTVNSYSSASLWDGKPQYQTGYGFGH